MKTASTQPLQFSGYPLSHLETAKEEMPVVRPAGADKKATALPVKTQAIDAPENWDESWFANYE